MRVGGRGCGINGVSETEYACHGLSLGDQGRLLGGGERQITRATYIFLDKLSVHHAGSRDQLLGIEVNEAVAGLHQEKRGGRRFPGYRQLPATSKGQVTAQQSLGLPDFFPTSLKFHHWNFTFWGTKCSVHPGL